MNVKQGILVAYGYTKHIGFTMIQSMGVNLVDNQLSSVINQ